MNVLDTRWQVKLVAGKIHVAGVQGSIVRVCEGAVKSESGASSDAVISRMNFCGGTTVKERRQP